MRGYEYEYLYLPSPLLTKEGKGGAGIVNKLLNTYKDDRKGGASEVARGILRGIKSAPHGRGDRKGILRGFGPARRGPFVSAKGPKTIGARAWPFGCLCPGPERLGLRNSLRSNSPRPQLDFGTGAQPRPQAP